MPKKTAAATKPEEVTIAGIFLAGVPCPPQTVSTPFAAPRLTMDQVVDRAIARERALTDMLKTRTPLIETYLQDRKFDSERGTVPVQDHYFLGRLDLKGDVDRRDYLVQRGGFERMLLGGFNRLYKLEYNPLGFSWMIFADRYAFNRQTYRFKFDHREFLGNVRCLVFNVTPTKREGRVEDQVPRTRRFDTK